MAQLQSTSVTGSLNLRSTTSSPTSPGFLWFNTATNRLQYSYFDTSLQTCTFIGAIVAPPYTGL